MTWDVYYSPMETYYNLFSEPKKKEVSNEELKSKLEVIKFTLSVLMRLRK